MGLRAASSNTLPSLAFRGCTPLTSLAPPLPFLTSLQGRLPNPYPQPYP